MAYDVIVLGAGSMGISAGYYLARQNKKVLLVDAFDPPHTKGSHHGSTRIIRHAYGEGEQYVPLALRAQELWLDLEREIGQQLFFQTGVLNIGDPETDFIKGVIRSAQRYDLPLEVLRSEEIQKRWPGFSLPDHLVGGFEATSGVLKSEEAIRSYRQLAERHGATILTHTKVNDISIREDGVTIVANGQAYEADRLIVTVGAWAANLLPSLNLQLPLTPVRKVIAWYKVDEAEYNGTRFPAFTFHLSDGSQYYGFPSIEGAGLKVGRHDGGIQINPDEELAEFGTYQEDEQDLTNLLSRYISGTEKVLDYGKACMYSLTPDENFIIDLHPDHPHVAIAAGFSGHGFKFASVVGEVLSHLVTKGTTDYDISLFPIKRTYA